MTSKITSSGVLQRLGMAFAAMTMAGLLAACGGGSDAPPAAAAPAAAITAQPTDQSAVAGSTATFSVTATNATGYQWQRSNYAGTSFADVSGATAATYTTAATTPADNAAQYRVVVYGSANSVTSSAATLTVTSAAMAPGISVQPAPQTITAGQNASFSVTATGTSLSYQWQHSMDGGTTYTAEAGATNATLTLNAVAQVHNGHFLRVVVSNSLGSVTSTAALLTVNAATAAATITQSPVNQSVTAPATATFSAAASGTPTPTLQWQINVAGSWSDIAGAISASYTTPATTVGDNGKQYRVIATNATGSVTSNMATLTVSPAATMPAITAQPTSVTTSIGQDAQFTVAVSGSPTPGLQWQVSIDGGTTWDNIVGENGAVFRVVNAGQADSGRQFRAGASNSAGSVNSTAASLTVNASTLAIQTATVLPPGVPNLPYSTVLSATGGRPPYFWSSPGASVLQTYGLSLNPSTGEISGTPTEVAISFFVDVTDSSSTPQTAQKDFSLRIEAPCDSGLGSATVANAPNTVQGKFCPQTKFLPGVPNGLGLVVVAWSDNNSAARVFKNVGVEFFAATGQISSVGFNLNDPTTLATYLCLAVADASRPACNGVTLNTATGAVTFVNTVLGNAVPPLTLNGTLRY